MNDRLMNCWLRGCVRDCVSGLVGVWVRVWVYSEFGVMLGGVFVRVFVGGRSRGQTSGLMFGKGKLD